MAADLKPLHSLLVSQNGKGEKDKNDCESNQCETKRKGDLLH